jgi:hypothetical protein
MQQDAISPEVMLVWPINRAQAQRQLMRVSFARALSFKKLGRRSAVLIFVLMRLGKSQKENENR